MLDNNQELINAMSMVLPVDQVVFEYRVYYDSVTKSCILKTISEAEGQYVVVTAEEYEKIDFCPNFYLAKDGLIKKKNFDFTSKKLLQLSNAGVATLKNNNIFVCTTPSNTCDFWEPKLHD